jgi:predicted DNA-binding transcriptional regulator AlpA
MQIKTLLRIPEVATLLDVTTARAYELARTGALPAVRIGRPLDERRIVRRTWRKIRSGEWIGSRGEFRVLACECGAERGVLWSVDMAPWPGRAA